jgi:hypothetical protein
MAAILPFPGLPFGASWLIDALACAGLLGLLGAKARAGLDELRDLLRRRVVFDCELTGRHRDREEYVDALAAKDLEVAALHKEIADRDTVIGRLTVALEETQDELEFLRLRATEH